MNSHQRWSYHLSETVTYRFYNIAQAIWSALLSSPKKTDGAATRMSQKGAIDGLSDLNQIVTWIAGKAAEEYFKCLSYESAWWDDMERIHRLLSKPGVPDDRHRLVIAEANMFVLLHDRFSNL